jgi:hypothetical protein
MVGQATAATRSLKEETGELSRLVARFRIEEPNRARAQGDKPAAQRPRLAAYASGKT